MRFRIILAALFVVILSSAGAQKVNYKVGLIGFYNVENLYDTIDDPIKNDAEYLPSGTKRYNSAIYLDKIGNLSKVLSQIGTDLSPDGLSIIGVAEVENDSVMHDLASHPLMKSRNYQIVHHNSPDIRGVDVGMLYNPKYFTLISSEPLFVPLFDADGSIRYTRDILFVHGKYDGEELYVMVCHWPSRRGGEEVSAPGRAKAASICRNKIDSLTRINPDIKIILMGDLNDDPVSPSVAKVLGAKENKEKVQKGELFNPWFEPYKQGIGTLAYQDSWNLFDQIIVSSGFLPKEQNGFFFREARIFSKPWMLQTEGRYKGYGKRTYDFDNYISGYSDHFPTYIVLLKKSQ